MIPRKIIALPLLLTCCLAAVRGQTCKGGGACGVENKAGCESYKPAGMNIRTCCWDPNGKKGEQCHPKIVGAVSGPARNFGGNKEYQDAWKEYIKKSEIKGKSRATSDAKELEKAKPPKELGGQKSVTRGLNILGGSPFGPLGGGGGGPLGGIGSILLGLAFPECPVNLKICRRASCPGGHHIQTNPEACLSNPSCCYDFELAFYKSLYGPRYMADAPLCYLGATSKQWLYITGLVRPWNPWLTSLVIDLFEDFFDLSLINIGGKVACSIKAQITQVPGEVTTKLDCNLVDGCWDEDEQRCFKASEIALNLLGYDTQIYPALYTNNYIETQCSNNPFDFGPRAYTRQPCGLGDQPDSVIDVLYKWCPQDQCCLNYLGLDKDILGEIVLYNQLGLGAGGGLFSGGNPLIPRHSSSSLAGNPLAGGVLAGNPLAGSALAGNPLAILGLSGDIKEILCPYYFLKIPGLPDLSDKVDGCCKIPTCYYRKKLYGGGRGPVYPPPTHVPPPPPVQYGEYGPWEQCNGQCGQYGVQYRTCFVGNQPAPGQCNGPRERQCTPPCAEPGRWTSWQYMGCSTSCGYGTARFTRTCEQYGRPVDPSVCGGNTAKEEPCNNSPCQPTYRWGQIVATGPCSRTCGNGRQTYQQACYSQAGQRVSDHFCRGPPQREQRDCISEPCRAQAIYGPPEPAGPCSVTCGGAGGTQPYRKRCLYNGDPNQEAPIYLCQQQGPSEEYKSCFAHVPCPQSGVWVYKKVGECGATCGEKGLQLLQRYCYADQRGQVKIDSSNCRNDGNPEYTHERCIRTNCDSYFTAWTAPVCRGQNGRCLQSTTVTLACYEQQGSYYSKIDDSICWRGKAAPTKSVACDVTSCLQG